MLAVGCMACLWGNGAGLRGGHEGWWLRERQGRASHMSSVGLAACGLDDCMYMCDPGLAFCMLS